MDNTLNNFEKSLMTQIPSYSEEDWKAAKKTFEEWINKNEGIYYMLLSYDLKYFTIFKKDPCFGITEKENFFDILRECLENLGEVQDIGISESNSETLEIWIKNDSGENYAALLNWDEGVVNFYAYM